jgi:hypothetical protein
MILVAVNGDIVEGMYDYDHILPCQILTVPSHRTLSDLFKVIKTAKQASGALKLRLRDPDSFFAQLKRPLSARLSASFAFRT